MTEESITRIGAIAKALELLTKPSVLHEYRQNELLEAQTWLMVANTIQSAGAIRRNDDSPVNLPNVARIVRAIDDLGVAIRDLKETLTLRPFALRQPEEPERPPE